MTTTPDIERSFIGEDMGFDVICPICKERITLQKLDGEVTTNLINAGRLETHFNSHSIQEIWDFYEQAIFRMIKVYKKHHIRR